MNKDEIQIILNEITRRGGRLTLYAMVQKQRMKAVHLQSFHRLCREWNDTNLGVIIAEQAKLLFDTFHECGSAESFAKEQGTPAAA